MKDNNCVNFVRRRKLREELNHLQTSNKTEALVPSPYRQLTDSHLSVQSRELSSEYRIIKYIFLILRRGSKIEFFLTFRNQDANQVKYTALTALDGLMSLLV